MKLDRETIIDAAFTVLDEHGLDGLSLRALGRQLGVQAPAFYWHVHSKAELIALMAASFYAEAATAQTAVTGRSARLIAFGHAFRAALLRRRDAARLVSTARPLDSPEVASRRLVGSLGANETEAYRALSQQAAVIAYTLGWAVYEQSETMHAHLVHMIDFAESFDAGLRAMVHGFASDDVAVVDPRRS